mmetsp:Transcript_141160/g.199927  ORF Transcript_141160/g.199927 Transcript_141160/m.199927 type:complete len:98 (+) Transcript_141160:52-345(+)
MSKEEIKVKKMSKEDAEKEYNISKWGQWGCDISKFDWTYSGKEVAYILEGEVLVTPTGAWSGCKPTKVEAGDFVEFPDGMTCIWDVTKAIKKHYNFP